ncbi:hypothetical protein, partial [Cognatilysobacter lacus]
MARSARPFHVLSHRVAAAMLLVVAGALHAGPAVTPVADILKAAESALGGAGAQVQASVDAAVR